MKYRNGVQVGDFVKISSDVEKVKEYQEGHGDWVDSMIHVSVRVCGCGREGVWEGGREGGYKF